MMLNNKIIYIIGFMGCGKTTAGKKLASALGWSFIDLDKKIEEHAGMAIPEIFSEKGEDFFRIVEAEVLRDLKSVSTTVISTGGGTPCYADNMDFMLENGLTIYLRLSPGQLQSRLSDSKGERPLIKNMNKEDLLGFIGEKLKYREKWYNRAEIVIDGISLDINDLHVIVKSRINI